MSIKLMTMAWALPLPTTEKLGLLALCDWANDVGGSLFPSVAALARRVSCSDRTAQRLLRSLEADGWLQVVGNVAGGAPGMTRHYRIDVPKLSAAFSASELACASETGDKLTPVQAVDNAPRRVTNGAETGDTCVTPDAETGDTGVARRVTPVTQTGDTGVTRTTIEPSIEPSIEYNPLTAFGDVDKLVLSDWLAFRKKRKADVTATVEASFRREAALAGKSVEDAMRTCLLRGWTGFEASWLLRGGDGQAGGVPRSGMSSARVSSHSGFEQKNYREGIGHDGSFD